jgi:hypothetical protein
MDIEAPDDLLRRLKLGREEYTQRLLTTLILEAPYPRWNTAHPPSRRGLEFLTRLEDLSYADPGPWHDPVFIDEFDLPRRHDEERGGAPDWTLRDDTRLWMIELKTEAGSHRADQLPAYYELGRHHYPGHRIDLTYLTGPLEKDPPVVPESSRYAHLTWEQVMPAVEEIWGGSRAEYVEQLRAVLGALDSPWSTWRAERLGIPVETAAPAPAPDPIAVGMSVARKTATDHQQRAIDIRVDSLEDLQRLRVELRDALLAGETVTSVKPWIWRQASSGGQPLTELGAEVGYELRVSWYR